MTSESAYLQSKFVRTCLWWCWYGLILVLLFSCSHQPDRKIIRLAHGLDTNHPVHQAMVYMGDRLELKSKGTIEVLIYPGGQLGAERECLELLQIGSLDITKVSAAVLENFIPEYKVLSVPYIFKNTDHAHRIFDGQVGEEILAKGAHSRLRGLTFYDAGSRSFYTKTKTIDKPEDLVGLKIRVQKSNMAVAMVNLLGGSPTPISWGELYTALQQGVVDGAENNLPSFYTSKHYEVCKYYSLNQHTAVPDVLLVGLDSWNRFSRKEQAWIREAAKESAQYQRRLWKASEEESIKAIKKAGVIVTYPAKYLFEEKTRNIISIFENDPEILDIINKIRNEK
ncbi:MAG: TRAP transporter substrate-binding protein [Flavobacteriaceae bacterium]